MNMEFVDLRMVQKKYEAEFLASQTDRHMTAVGNILVSRVDDVTSRYISFGMPGFSMWEGFVQPYQRELTKSCFGGETQKGHDGSQLDGSFIPYSDNNAIGCTDQEGNFHVYNLPNKKGYGEEYRFGK